MSTAIAQLREQIACDSCAITFQTTAHYRAGLLVLIDKLSAQTPTATARRYSRDEAETVAQDLIALGWHNDSLTCVDSLHALLQRFLSTYRCEVHT